MSMVAGPLSDNRLQVFVSYRGSIWSAWQLSADPESKYSPWTQMKGTGGAQCVATCPLPDGSLALFAVGSQGAMYCQKLSPDVAADWSGFSGVFESNYALSIAAIPLPWSDGQIEAFVLANDPGTTSESYGQLYQTIKSGSSFTDTFAPAKFFDNPGPWFFGRVPLPSSPAAGLLLAARLPNNQIQLWFNSPVAGSAGSPIFSTWGGADNSDWPGWEPFERVPDNKIGWQLAVGELPDRRLQLWAFSNTSSVLYSCWKETADADSIWTPWTTFAGALERNVLSLAVAPLSDGRLQLWALYDNNAIWSKSKVTADPEAGWTPWSSFNALP